jgi:hypothetical protein
MCSIPAVPPGSGELTPYLLVLSITRKRAERIRHLADFATVQMADMRPLPTIRVGSYLGSRREPLGQGQARCSPIIRAERHNWVTKSLGMGKSWFLYEAIGQP